MTAAYVLGALSPAERLEFEHHLAGCEECARAVREVAGLPGLLAGVEPAVLEHAPEDDPLPDSLLALAARRACVAAVVAAGWSPSASRRRR